MSLDHKHLEELLTNLEPMISEVTSPRSPYSTYLIQFSSADRGKNLEEWSNVRIGYINFLNHCLDNKLSYEQIEKASQILIESLTNPSLKKILNVTQTQIFNTAYKPLNNACKEVVNDLFKISQDMKGNNKTLVAENILGFSQEMEKLQKRYNTSRQQDAYDILQTDLKGLQQWCTTQAEKSKDSNYTKISNYISSALGFLKSVFNRDKVDQKTHSATMDQMRRELFSPEKNKDFKEHLDETQKKVQTFAEKILQEKNNPSSQPRFRL